MSATPGNRTPGEAEAATDTITEQDVAIDATGTTTLGGVVGDEIVVKEVYVISTAQDFDFNVEVSGSDVFANEQSPSSGSEGFTPDQNARVAGTDAAQVALDVSGASASGGATADVHVVTEYHHG